MNSFKVGDKVRLKGDPNGPVLVVRDEPGLPGDPEETYEERLRRGRALCGWHDQRYDEAYRLRVEDLEKVQ